MSEYKCVSCGYIKENDKECNCPECGYKMFATPYDRRDKLMNEVNSFISLVSACEVKRQYLEFDGKEKDDKRFPTFETIRNYVASADRIEVFLSRIKQSIEQIRIHFQTPFSNTYKIKFSNLEMIIDEKEETLIEAAKNIIPKQYQLEKIEWPKGEVGYSETQNKYLFLSADELFDMLDKLSDKIHRFVKLNNIYGNGHKFVPEKQKKNKHNNNPDYKEKLEDAIENIDSILRKKYEVDITEDGSEQLEEMLTVLWNSIELIMSCGLLQEEYKYFLDDKFFSEEKTLDILSKLCEARFAEIKYDTKEKLAEIESEEDLFDIYNRMIELDSGDYMGVNRSKLLRIGESEAKLNKLIGLMSVKNSISKIKAYMSANKDNGVLNLHMCFYGNPGTGKTEVARYIAGILHESGALPTGKVVEVDRSGLVSPYFGATADKTKRIIQDAMGGVLFIDEAYALANNNDQLGATDYGKEAIDTLVKAMEDNRGKLCVVFAGYKNEMKKMIASNPGLKSRIQFELDFDNYSRDELKQIAELMLKRQGYDMGENAMNRILDITDVRRKEPNFANAREIRNIIDQVIMCQNLRTLDGKDKVIGIADVNKYIADSKINLPKTDSGATAKILTGEEELEQLIGLSSVKRMILKIKAYAKKNKDSGDFNLHMCFYGNPGTGKTEVARILSRILHDAGVLPEAKLVETDSHGLLGQYVGETGSKTLNKINEAMNGVLFIDEAYGLTASRPAGGESLSYGDEAITVLLKEMEDHRGQFCTILAGYKNEMKDLLSANPGFESRIQFTIEFPDYSREELGEIALKFLSKKKYEIEDSALELLLDITDYYRNRPNFANARTVRNILDQVIMNQNLRTEDVDDDNMISIEDVEDYISDESIDLNNKGVEEHHIGFT